MPFDGNGSYELPHDFVADRDAGFPSNRILAQRVMDTLEDIGAALEQSATVSAARLTGTSTSSVAIGTGNKTFTTQANKAFTVGRWVLIASDADTANYMHGRVTSYSGTTLQVDITNVGGTGTLADWTITISGTRGGTGSIGATGPGYTATSTTSLATAGSGSKTFTTQAGLAYTIGARVRATSVGTSEWMEGLVTSYSGTSLQVTMDLNSGTGTHADWTINLAGERGAAGAGTGDVVGPASATDEHVPIFDGATGKLLKSSGVSLNDVIAAAVGASGDVVGPAGATDNHFVQYDGTTGKLLKGGIAFDTDDTMAADSDSVIPSQNAVRAYVAAHTQGRETLVVPASHWAPTITNGAGRSYTELATNDLISETLDFDTTTQQFATYEWFPPKKWNAGTVTFRVWWRVTGGSSTQTLDLAGNASGTLVLGSQGGTSQPLVNGSRLAMLMAWEGRDLSGGEIMALFQASRGRFGV